MESGRVLRPAGVDGTKAHEPPINGVHNVSWAEYFGWARAQTNPFPSPTPHTLSGPLLPHTHIYEFLFYAPVSLHQFSVTWETVHMFLINPTTLSLVVSGTCILSTCL